MTAGGSAMFQGFSQQTGDFLWSLAMNNDRTWFQAHKQEFEDALNQPFRALANEVLALMRERWPEWDFGLHISRIYRDARRLFGRGPYKDHLWFTVQSGGRHESGPTFWFEVDGVSWTCGMGWWEPAADHAAAWRAAIDADPDRFIRLVRGLPADYRLWGDEYKRPKGDRGEIINPWYNRRSVSIGRTQGYGGVMYTPELPRAVVDYYAALMPMHQFYQEVWNAVLTERAGRA